MADNNSAPEWRVVQEFPDYEVSDWGVVRRLVDHHTQPKRFPAGSIVSASLIGSLYKRKDGTVFDDRYPSVWLHSRETGKRCRISLSRLVLFTFEGAPPDETYEAAHNNGNRLENGLSNLRWDTRKGNHADRPLHGTDKRGEDHWHAKLTAPLVLEILAQLAAGSTCRDLSAPYGVTESAISCIKNGTSWKHLPRPASLRTNPRKLRV